MMVPEGIALLLFVLLAGSSAGSNEELIILPEKTETKSEGSSVTISCVYKSQKNETYKLLWFKDPIYYKHIEIFNGTIVYSNTEERPQSPGYSSRVEYITNATSQIHQDSWIKCDLRISDLQMTDSGQYSFRFIVSYEKKYMSKAMNLTVTENPCKVHIEPLELKNPLKDSEEFTVRCSTIGSCDSHPEWLVHTSEEKQEWTSSSSSDMIIETEEGEGGRKVTKLKLNVTWKDDNRTLSCRPEKSKDSCQIRNITLLVEHSPRNVRIDGPTSVKEGTPLTLTCSADADPQPHTYTWKHTHGLSSVPLSVETAELNIENVTIQHAGQYTCDVTDTVGSGSHTIKVDVLYVPKNVTASIKGEQTFGSELTLTCEATANPAPSSYEWKKGSIGELNNVEQKHEQRLHFPSLEISDSGQYFCIAQNSIGKTESPSVDIKVKYSPRNIRIDGTTSVKVGTPLTLTCSADADPQPHTYTWKHIHGLSSVPLSTEYALNIENVTIQHAGQYTCDVTNTMGTGSHTIKVDVLYPPSNLNLIMKSKVRNFEVISIVCTVQSFPESNLTVTGPLGDLRYIQNNRGNSTVSANMLTVYLNVTESDAGTYTCKAENQEGKNYIKQELNMTYVPKNVTASIKGEQTFGSEPTLTYNFLTAFYQIILPIILLLILIVVAVFLIRRTIIKTRQSPKQQNTVYMDNGAAASSQNDVTLDFNGQNEPEKKST